jgi:SAM-dependent methyltransferase
MAADLLMTHIEMETPACLICGATRSTVRFHLHDWACELPGEFQLVTCETCGHMYQSPRPTQAVIGEFYPEDYQPFWRAIDAEPHWWRRVLRRWQWRTRCRQVSQVRAGGRILDVGASTGVFLSEMRRYGAWTVAGVELSAQAAQYARETFNLDLFVGQVESAPWPPHSFDVVTLWDVLEHLPEPALALKKIRELLAEDGYLIVSVPNGDSVDARLFGRYWIGLDAPRHMSVFNRTSLQRLMRDTGYTIEAAYCYYGRYTTFALSLQQWLRAHLRRSALRRGLERGLSWPLWRYLTLPYFWTLDQWRLGAILTLRARPARTP